MKLCQFYTAMNLLAGLLSLVVSARALAVRFPPSTTFAAPPAIGFNANWALQSLSFTAAINDTTYENVLSKRAPIERLPTFKPDGHPQIQKLKKAFQEAIVLAGLTFKDMNKCEPSFDRYFMPEDWDWVRSIFGFISGSFESNFPLGSQLFPNSVTVWAGDLPGVSICSDTTEHVEGYTHNNPDPTIPNANKAVHIAICPRVWNYPMLAEIDCDDLGYKDSRMMEPLAGVVLHEMTHIAALTARLPGRERLVAFKGQTAVNHIIGDFVPMDGEHGAVPRGGGAFLETRDLRYMEGMGLVKAGRGVCRSNADSYVVFMLSRYWSWKCGREFKMAD